MKKLNKVDKKAMREELVRAFNLYFNPKERTAKLYYLGMITAILVTAVVLKNWTLSAIIIFSQILEIGMIVWVRYRNRE